MRNEIKIGRNNTKILFIYVPISENTHINNYIFICMPYGMQIKVLGVLVE